MFVLLFQLRKLLEYNIVQHLDVGSLHAGRAGLYHACAFELPQGIYNNGTRDPYSVCNLAGNQNSTINDS